MYNMTSNFIHTQRSHKFKPFVKFEHLPGALFTRYGSYLYTYKKQKLTIYDRKSSYRYIYFSSIEFIWTQGLLNEIYMCRQLSVIEQKFSYSDACLFHYGDWFINNSFCFCVDTIKSYRYRVYICIWSVGSSISLTV